MVWLNQLYRKIKNVYSTVTFSMQLILGGLIIDVFLNLVLKNELIFFFFSNRLLIALLAEVIF